MDVPAFALPLVIALQLIAGAAISVGWHARCGAAALVRTGREANDTVEGVGRPRLATHRFRRRAGCGLGGGSLAVFAATGTSAGDWISNTAETSNFSNRAWRLSTSRRVQPS